MNSSSPLRNSRSSSMVISRRISVPAFSVSGTQTREIKTCASSNGIIPAAVVLLSHLLLLLVRISMMPTSLK